ncbi:hypothetical protein [Terriglobus sp. RCC_193]
MPHFEVLLRTSKLAGEATANAVVASRILSLKSFHLNSYQPAASMTRNEP